MHHSTQVVGEYHLGEFVNRFRHGSLVMRMPDAEVGLWLCLSGVFCVASSVHLSADCWRRPVVYLAGGCMDGLGTFRTDVLALP